MKSLIRLKLHLQLEMIIKVWELAKTDALDARILAEFAAVVRPKARPLADRMLADVQARVGLG